MATTTRQFSFAAGEISRSFYARSDLVRYATGARTFRNFLVKKSGGADNRPGTELVGEAAQRNIAVRLVGWEFNADQTYMLEFGNTWMRVIHNGAYVTLTPQGITAITNAAQCKISYSGSDTYANGDEVFVIGIVGPIGRYLNNRNFKVANVDAGAHTFTLRYMDAITDVNSTSFGAYDGGGTVAEIYEMSTPYTQTPYPTIRDLQFVQVADVMIITHPIHHTKVLTRTGHSAWTLSNANFDFLDRGSFASIAKGAAGSNEYRYRVCAIGSSGEEAQPILYGIKVITGISRANPARVTAVAHGFVTGDEVFFRYVVGMIEPGVVPDSSSLNFKTFRIIVIDVDNFDLESVDTSTWSAWLSGGTASREYFVLRSAAAPTSGDPHVMTFYRPAHSGNFNIYRSDGDGVYGFIGAAYSNVGPTLGLITFKDVGATPDLSISNPMATYPFENKDGEGYPAACGVYQQRLLLGGLRFDPEAVYASKVGSLFAFAPSPNLEDDSPISFKMFGRQVNQVRYFVDLGELLNFTDGGEWAVEGGGSGILTPTQVNAKQHTYNGSSSFSFPDSTEVTLAPIIVDGYLVYVQASGSVVRDISFNFDIDGYKGNDLTIFSTHLFKNRKIKSWAYQKYPNSILWMVMDDGALLGLTYIRDHQMLGWHRHDTDGFVESVAVIKENGEDSLYLSVRRTIQGVAVRYIERMASRDFTDIREACFMDSSLVYDGRNTSGINMELSGGSTWDAGEIITLTASDPFFVGGVGGDEGNAIDITGPDGDVIRCLITHVSTTTLVDVIVNRLVPENMRSPANFTVWTRCIDELTGFWHLEGKNVSVLGDGGVVANPNNSKYIVITVANGTIALPELKGIVRGGLPYTSDLQTLAIESPQGPTMLNKKKLINQVTTYLEDSRGGLWASREPLSDSDLDGFSDLPPRTDEDYGELPNLLTGPFTVDLESEWSKEGRIFIRQTDPLPLSVLSVVPTGYIPAGVS